MKIKHNELLIEPSDPFINCRLGREKYASVLTGVLSTYSEGFVLAIDGKWGTGKTTFVKMWQQDLNNNDFKTVYFNAWENDFEDDPLAALMAELKSVSDIKTEQKYASTLKKAAVFAKTITPGIVKAIANKYVDTDIIKELLEGTSKGITETFQSKVNDYANRKNGIKEFKESLSDFINETVVDKPVVFIIDELDRCRPDYAVSVLEKVKHFFSIPNIVFVLSIDKEQLGNAVKGVYGSECLDSEEYLKRFIDLEYILPKPKQGDFYNYLYDYYEFDSFLKSEERLKYTELRDDAARFKTIGKLLFNSSDLTLRSQEKILGMSRLCLQTFNENHYVMPFVFLYLLFVKSTNSQLYSEIRNKSASFELILKEINDSINYKNTDTRYEEKHSKLWLAAIFLNSYRNYVNEYRYENKETFMSNVNSDNEYDLTISSPYDKETKERFCELVKGMTYGREENNINLNHFLERIDLLEPLKN